MLKPKPTVDDDSVAQLTFCYRRALREKFVGGELGIQWAKDYPQLFDEDDRRLYDSQCELGYHFFEWLGALPVILAQGFIHVFASVEA